MKQEESLQKDLSRIKEILFGEELQGLDTRLEELRKELTNVIEHQVKTLDEKLQKQKEDFQKLVKALENKLEEEKKDRKKLENTLQKTRQEYEIVIKEKTGEFDKKLNGIAQKLRSENGNDMKSLKAELLKELNKLDEVKVNKTEIAELFGLMIQKLK